MITPQGTAADLRPTGQDFRKRRPFPTAVLFVPTGNGGYAVAHTGDGADTDRVSEPLLLAAGVADLAYSGIGAALRGARSLLGRSDLAELARDGRQELRQRGELALRRYAPTAESHMELLARRAASASSSRPGQSDG